MPANPKVLMARFTALGLTSLALALGASAAAAPQSVAPAGLKIQTGEAAPRPPAVRRVIIRNQLILKIPLQPRQSTPIQYQVLDAPRCLSTRAIAGARMSGARTIDFLLSRERRLRVHMDEDCKSLDFYGGFYLQPVDERLCAGRDVIRTRMGGNCKIDRFQLLQPMGAAPLASQ